MRTVASLTIRPPAVLCAALGLAAVALLLGHVSDGTRLASAAAVAAEATPAATAPTNLIGNPSFEQGTKNKVAQWRPYTWAGKAEFSVDESVARSGKRSVVISSQQGADAAWTFTAVVEPLAEYRLTGWIKTENVQAPKARGALLNIHNLPGAATKALTGTNDWTQVELTFETGETDSIQINCLFGGWGQATGKAWYDDLQLVQTRAARAAEPRITIDASKVGEPISKYIYGQFIEHLGRCIYGGIWAEMLEDRKFFYAVGAKQSPWRPIGDSAAITMVRQRPFVGEHTPRIALAPEGQPPRGIAQAALGVLSGKRYTGYIWLAAEGDVAKATVSLIWGDGPQDRQTVTIDKPAAEFTKHPLEFTAGARTDDARLEITGTGSGALLVGTVSLMPADNVRGMRADTLELLRQLDSPVYRWPGGNFVSGYNWRDGIGDRDRRPPRKNPAWQGVEHNDFGLDEFIVFCRLLKTEPYIAVNSGLGDAQSAADQVQYANGAADTPMGKLRAANGNPEPYRVKYWGIGNEMYGNWQLGHMPLEKYVVKNNQFYEAMKKVDPSIVLVAVGEVGRWSEGMLTHCANHMDLISEHFYRGAQPGLYGHVRQIPLAVRNIAQAHRRYRNEIPTLKGKDIRIALDEWNYWYGPHVFGELGTRYFLKDALGIAAGLNEYARQSDIIYMANYAQTVNVIGCIKTSKTAAAFETTGLVLKLYRHHFGVLPVETQASNLLDAQAAWSADRKALTLAVVNPSLRTLEVPLELKGAKLQGTAERWQIAGEDPMAYNDPDQPPKIVIEHSKLEGLRDRVTLAPCSVTMFRFDVQ